MAMTERDSDAADERSLAKLRVQFQSYASGKDREIEEFRLAHAYYSGDQYSTNERSILAKRKQPAITFNRIARKIDGVVGTVRKLRSDPKAFPQRPDQAEAAELATYVVRYVCDSSEFESIESEATLQAGIIGYGGLELGLKDTPEGDKEVELIELDSRTFFYDPRSFKSDFSDARYMGTYKWATVDEVEEIGAAIGQEGWGKLVEGAADGGFTTQADTDRDDKWRDEKGRVRLVDHWYIEKGKWVWCLHVGTVKLMSGESPFFDEHGRSICKFRVFSSYIDHEGDRYGFVRNMKGPQDAMNQHRSKALHIMNTRQIKLRRGSVPDIEKLRREAARPDGVLEYDMGADEFEVLQPAQEFLQQTQYFQDAKDEIENFGPNQALLGTNMNAKSGRALAMMQQSGLAELGPFLKNLRMWKLDVYKAIWTNTKRYCTAEKILRITGDEKAAQFIEINKQQMDPMGQPIIVNQLGQIDVDIRIEEGPDTETVMGDTFDTLQALANNNMPVPPQLIIEMSNLPGSVKEKLTQMSAPPPEAQQAQAKMQQLETMMAEAKIMTERATAMLREAQARQAMTPEQPQPGLMGDPGPTMPEVEETLASAEDKRASAILKLTQAEKVRVDTMLAPQQLAAKASADQARAQAMTARSQSSSVGG